LASTHQSLDAPNEANLGQEASAQPVTEDVASETVASKSTAATPPRKSFVKWPSHSRRLLGAFRRMVLKGERRVIHS
jgi:hypothetical protein